MDKSKLIAGLKMAGAVLLLGLAVFMVVRGGGKPPEDTRQAYYFDPDAGRLFVAGAVGVAPIPAPSDAQGGEPTGVRAYVFSCAGGVGSLDGMTPGEIEAAGAFIAWLERYTPEGKAVLELRGDRPDTDFETGISNKLIRGLGDSEWSPAESRRANSLRAAVKERCAGKSPTLCTP